MPFEDDSDSELQSLSRDEVYFKVHDHLETDWDIEPGMLNVTCWFVAQPTVQPDTHISEIEFPELEEIGLADLQEGVMEYEGDWTKEEMIFQLQMMGFEVRR